MVTVSINYSKSNSTTLCQFLYARLRQRQESSSQQENNNKFTLLSSELIYTRAGSVDTHTHTHTHTYTHAHTHTHTHKHTHSHTHGRVSTDRVAYRSAYEIPSLLFSHPVTLPPRATRSSDQPFQGDHSRPGHPGTSARERSVLYVFKLG